MKLWHALAITAGSVVALVVAFGKAQDNTPLDELRRPATALEVLRDPPRLERQAPTIAYLPSSALTAGATGPQCIYTRDGAVLCNNGSSGAWTTYSGGGSGVPVPGWKGGR